MFDFLDDGRVKTEQDATYGELLLYDVKLLLLCDYGEAPRNIRPANRTTNKKDKDAGRDKENYTPQEGPPKERTPSLPSSPRSSADLLKYVLFLMLTIRDIFCRWGAEFFGWPKFEIFG